MSKNKCPFVVVGFVKFNTVRLVDRNGEFHDRVEIGEAKKQAVSAGMDLVCFNEPAGDELAFCKIINFGKWQYAEKKKHKKNKVTKKTTKEIRFSPDIDDHDIEYKIKQVVEFLEDGDDVVFTMRLKGRQRVHFKEALEKMNHIVSLCKGNGEESSRKVSGSLILVRMGKTSQLPRLKAEACKVTYNE